MIYKCWCKLCDKSEHFDLMEHDINEMITFAIQEEISFISYWCNDCVHKIRLVTGSDQFIREFAALNTVMQGNQKGLQNVYDLFKRLTEEEFINNFNQRFYGMIERFTALEKRVYESEKLIKSSMKKIGTINNLYTLSKVNPLLINKLANVVNILNYEDDE